MGRLVALFLSPALVTGRYLSPADLLYEYYPWKDAPPAGWTGASNLLLNDSVLQFEPWTTYSAERLDAGALPLWNPYNLLGAPFVGNMQSAVFYPGNWLLLLSPGGALLGLRAWLRLVIAALGVYVLAREVARVRPLRAILAGVTFTFGVVPGRLAPCGYARRGDLAALAVVGHRPAGGAARPAGRGAPGRAGRAHLLAATPKRCLPSRTGNGRVCPFQVALLRPWIGAGRRGRWERGGQRMRWAWASPRSNCCRLSNTSPTAPPLSTATLAWSPRLAADPYAWTWISPDLFGNPAHDTWWARKTNYNESNAYAGMLPLLLLTLAPFVRRPAQRRLGGFLLGVIILALGIVYHWPIIGDLAQMIPLLQIARNNRLLLLLQLALGLGAALGLDALLQQPTQRRRWGGALALGLGIVLIGGVAVPWLGASDLFGRADRSRLGDRGLA